MEVVQLSTIIKEVKIILNENIAIDTILLDDPNQLELDELIKARIIDAVRFVHENARSEYLSQGDDLVGAISTNQDGTGSMTIPDNFLRLVVFQLESWHLPVFNLVSDNDPAYLKQKSKFTGVRGGPSKPVCAITSGIDGKIIEFYSVKPGTSAVKKKARYIPMPSIENNTLKICPKLKASVYYYCAGLVAGIFKDEVAASLFELSKNYL